MKHAQSRATAAKLAQLRARIQPFFRADTTAPGTTWNVPSAGHCAAVAAIVQAELGGEFVSATVEGQNHWFNRLDVGRHLCDVDLTGDQFSDHEPIQVAPAGQLYRRTHMRLADQLNDETLRRAILLAKRAGLTATVSKLTARLQSRELAAA